MCKVCDEANRSNASTTMRCLCTRHYDEYVARIQAMKQRTPKQEER